MYRKRPSPTNNNVTGFSECLCKRTVNTVHLIFNNDHLIVNFDNILITWQLSIFNLLRTSLFYRFFNFLTPVFFHIVIFNYLITENLKLDDVKKLIPVLKFKSFFALHDKFSCQPVLMS